MTYSYSRQLRIFYMHYQIDMINTLWLTSQWHWQKQVGDTQIASRMNLGQTTNLIIETYVLALSHFPTPNSSIDTNANANANTNTNTNTNTNIFQSSYNSLGAGE